MSSQSMSSETIGNVYVVVQSSKNPDDREWDQNVELQTSLAPIGLRILVWSDGGGPNAKQRQRLNERLNGYQPLTAIMTPSALVRAIGVALSWANSRLRMFPPDQIDKALEHLQATPEERVQLLTCLNRLRAKVSPQAQRARTG